MPSTTAVCAEVAARSCAAYLLQCRTPQSDALQTNSSYHLAHIQVNALQAGTATFDFVSTPCTVVSDDSGTAITGLAYQATSVLIQSVANPPPPPPAGETPELSTMFLLISGLVLMIAARVRRRTPVALP